MVAESSTSRSKAARKEWEPVGLAWVFETSEHTPSGTHPPISHTYSNKAAPSSPSLKALLPDDQAFKNRATGSHCYSNHNTRSSWKNKNQQWALSVDPWLYWTFETPDFTELHNKDITWALLACSQMRNPRLWAWPVSGKERSLRPFSWLGCFYGEIGKILSQTGLSSKGSLCLTVQYG